MPKRILTTMLAVLSCALMVNAQTDYTQLITNPSFESGFNGWEFKSLSIQSNSVFSIKAGTNYAEKWTGKGGAVGNALVKQTVKEMLPGKYKLTAAAQNIQEDSPSAAQTGAWIFAGEKTTTVTTRNTYAVEFSFISGSIDIGFEASAASGNWIAVDNFKLALVSADLSEELAEAIEQTIAAYGNASGKEIQQLKDAITAAQAVAAKTDATAEEQAAAIVAMEEAVYAYQLANASADQPLDMTGRITNPSFETGDLTGWTASGMSTMNNDFFKVMKGTWYVEKWTWRGNAAGDARLSQQLTGMPAGRYRLTVAAQNIQEDTPQVKQTGAWIFAGGKSLSVNLTNDYALEFMQTTDVMEIGFNAKGATGNWLSVDNFRLEYIGEDFYEVNSELDNMIARAQHLLRYRMNQEARQTLTAAIDAALTMQATAERADAAYTAAATALETAYAAASNSQAIFARLANAIAAANEEVEGIESLAASNYRNAIADAQAAYDAVATTDAQAEAAITALTNASFAFRIENSSGTPPTVTTDTRFIRGCTWAFGRSTVKGSNILEEGFCWSTNPDPKVTDNRTTEYLNQAGKIYWLRDLKPATMYYMRAYAITKDYAVGYGDVIKFCTVPKGTVGHWYNNGGDEATNDRINYAINTAMDYYWNNLTSIHGFSITVNYSPGTPTADCSYGGWMRVGESSSYQQPGTIMHEALHGIGVGTHDIWWNGEMRSAGNRGDWLGDRVTEAVRFWDNSPTAVITGDDMHLWPYGCNGAHEDTHSDNLYCMMGILAQALNEDGLPGSGEIGYALPYYAFNQEDGVKYYIKNENENRGLRSAYLVETEAHALQWKTMSAEEAAADDAAAWYISFKPSNQYYQLRNAASGYYITYNSGIKTANHTTPTTADNFQLMRGRVDVDGYRGYYIIHPESSANPPCLNAAANGKTSTGQWSIAKSASTQRWIILTAEQALNFDNGNIELAREELTDLLAQIRKLAQAPHTEDSEGADATLSNTLSDIEAQAAACTKGSEISTLIEQTRTAAMNFLSSVTATSEEQPFDLTFMIENPNFDTSATTGWTSTNGDPVYEAQAAEFFQKTFDFYQILNNMPSGNYQLLANAFQRPGNKEAVYTPYKNGIAKVTSSLYINNTTNAVKHICDDRQSTALFNDGGWGSDYSVADGKYIPNCMVGAAKYFDKGLYESSVNAMLDKAGSTFRFGIKCTSYADGYWTMFDHFRLYFYGGNKMNGIEEIEKESTYTAPVYYDLQGQRVTNFKKGIYIAHPENGNRKGKKVIIK